MEILRSRQNSSRGGDVRTRWSSVLLPSSSDVETRVQDLLVGFLPFLRRQNSTLDAWFMREETLSPLVCSLVKYSRKLSGGVHCCQQRLFYCQKTLWVHTFRLFFKKGKSMESHNISWESICILCFPISGRTSSSWLPWDIVTLLTNRAKLFFYSNHVAEPRKEELSIISGEKKNNLRFKEKGEVEIAMKSDIDWKASKGNDPPWMSQWWDGVISQENLSIEV